MKNKIKHNIGWTCNKCGRLNDLETFVCPCEHVKRKIYKKGVDKVNLKNKIN